MNLSIASGIPCRERAVIDGLAAKFRNRRSLTHAIHAPRNTEDEQRGQFLRLMASSSMRAAVERHYGSTPGRSEGTRIEAGMARRIEVDCRISNELNNRSFMQAPPEQRNALLERASPRKRRNPKNRKKKFFALLKSQVAYAYYTSKIGIHNELEYKGNTYLKEFASEDMSKK